MFKILFLAIILCCNSVVNAQVGKAKPKPKTTVKPTAKKAAALPARTYKTTAEDSTFVNNVSVEICKCLAPSLDSLHPAVITMLEEMLVKGEKVAQENLTKTMLKMTEEEQKSLEASFKKMDAFGEPGNGFDKCSEAMDKKFGDVDFGKNKAKEKAYDNLLIELTKQNCKAVGIILALGNKKSK